MSKTYQGRTLGDVAEVKVFDEDDPAPLGRVYDLAHHVRHSPGGFSWGYAGSGPAELARCLLWDHLGFPPTQSLYQAYKFAVIARLPRGTHPSQRWRLNTADLDAFIDDWLAERDLDPDERSVGTLADGDWLDREGSDGA